jgi:hypothetical protein
MTEKDVRFLRDFKIIPQKHEKRLNITTIIKLAILIILSGSEIMRNGESGI